MFRGGGRADGGVVAACGDGVNLFDARQGGGLAGDRAPSDDPAARMVQEMLLLPPSMPAGPNEPRPLSVPTTVEAGRAVTQTVEAAEGGRLEVEDGRGNRFVLTIPPDTLLYDIEISMAPVSSASLLEADGATLAGVRLEPDGLRFYDWVTLELMPPGGGRRAARGYGIHGVDDELYGYPLDVDPDRLLMHLLHFSQPIIVYGEQIGQVSPELPPEPPVVIESEPVGWEAQLSQAIRDVLAAERAAVLAGQPGSDNLAEVIEALMNLYFDKVIAPILERIQRDCAFAEANAHAPVGWARNGQLFGLGSDAYSAREAQVFPAIGKAFENCWDEMTAGCIDPNNPAHVQRALGLAHQAQLFALDEGKFDPSTVIDPDVPLSPKCGDVYGQVLWHSRAVQRTELFDGRGEQVLTVDSFVSVEANFGQTEGGGFEDLGSRTVYRGVSTMVTKADGCTVSDSHSVAAGSATTSGTDGGATLGSSGASASLRPGAVAGERRDRTSTLTLPDALADECGTRTVQQSTSEARLGGVDCAPDGSGSGLAGSAESGGTITFDCSDRYSAGGWQVDVRAGGSLHRRSD